MKIFRFVAIALALLLAAPAAHASTYFTVSNGKIYKPDGTTVFVPRGVALQLSDLSTAITNAQGQPLTTQFPGLNIIRLYVAIYPGGTQSASYAAGSCANIQTYVNRLTALGIVVAINDGTDSTGADNGGAAGVSYTTANGMLKPMTDYYTSLANCFLGNPYVWFASRNEPVNSSQGALTAEQVATYNAIRGTGNNTIIEMEQIGGGIPSNFGASYNMGANNTNGLTPNSSYATMSGIIWGPHFYNWSTNYSNDLATNVSELNLFVSNAQEIQSADGVVPVAIWEYGIGTGASKDPGGDADTSAVQGAAFGSIAWGYNSFQSANALTGMPNSTTLTTWGQKTANWISANATTTPPTFTESPDKTVVTTVGPTITDSVGNVFSISSAGKVVINGVADAPTGNVIELAYVSHVLWQENSAGNWYNYLGSPGNYGGPTTTSPLGGGTTPPVTGAALPAGFYHTVGNQIVAADGTNVRLACVGYIPVGVNRAYLTADLANVRAAGFNCIRDDFADADICPNGSCTNWTYMDDVVAAAKANNLKVVWSHHSNEGTNFCQYQQANGIWYDKNSTATVDGVQWNSLASSQDGCGTPGTVTYAQFKANSVAAAAHFAGNDTVIAWDLWNEPLYGHPLCGSACPTPDVNWGNNNGSDIKLMYQSVGTAVEAAGPGTLIIAEGVINFTGTFTNGTAMPSGANGIMDLSQAGARPLSITNAAGQSVVVYSVHDYPNVISGQTPDSGAAGVTYRNQGWGYLVINGTAPVWNGEGGSSCASGDTLNWCQAITDYSNGKAAGGPTFSTGQQGIGMDWWAWGPPGSTGNNNFPGTCADSTCTTMDPVQKNYWSTLLYTATGGTTFTESPDKTVVTTVGPIITDSHGNTFSISANAQIVINGTVDIATANVVELAYVSHVVWHLNSAGNWYNYLGTPGSYGGPTTTSPLNTGGNGKTSPPAPLTGSVTPQTWVSYDQRFAGVTLPSGKPFHFNVLPPAQYNASAYKYPLMIWLHPTFSGNPWYTGANTDPLFYIPNEPSQFNTVSFLTNYPGIVAVPYADQTCSGGDAVCNWGGWANNGTTGSGTNSSGDTGPNTFALLAMINYLETVYSIDPNRIYCQGFSLGGIGCEYLLLKYNAYNGNPAVFAAGSSTGGVLEINGIGTGPTSANATTMANVPVWWFSGANDTTSNPGDWNLPMWRLQANNSSYPPAITSASANRAGTSQMRFTLCGTCGHQETDSAGNPVYTNSTIMNWMFGTVASTGSPGGNGQFHVVNGQIISPSGQKFFPIGVNIGDFRSGVDMANAVTNFTTGAPLTTLFPGINFVRLALYGGGSASSPTAYPSPTSYDAFVNTMTSLGIVVEMEHHVETDGSTGGGGQGSVPALGDAWLTAENNNYAALAAHFKNNPYVWFGTTNEPPDASPGLSIWQRSNYDAIRNTGNTNPIMIEVWGSRVSGHGSANIQSGMVQSYYSTMTNVIWDPHVYGFMTDYSTDQATNNTNAAGVIAASQTITSADGTMPVIIGEYGPSTTGSSLDPNGTQTVTAVLQSGVGSAVWHWGQQDCCNNTNNGNTLTSLGTQVAAAIAAAANASPSETLHVNTISNVAANTPFTVTGSIVNATSTPVLQYQNNNGAWVALPAGAQVSAIAFSFTDPGLSTPGTSNNTVSVRDANNTAIVAVSNSFTVTGAESANNTIITATLTTPSFSDNFTSLSLHRTWQAGDKWQLIAPDTPDGRGGPNFGEVGDQFWVNPYNPSTPISGIYTQDSSGLHLGLLNTPAAQQSYINGQAGAAMPYVGGLLNTSQTSYQKYGYWETTVAVPRVPGFSFQADAENVQITGTWPPEIDLRISTDSSSVQTVLFEVYQVGSGWAQYTTSSSAGFDATKSHTYAWDWESDFITFFIDGVQVAQYPNSGAAYQTNPMFLFILTGANYIGNGDPSTSALPVSAQLTSVNIYPTRPAAVSSGSLVDSVGEVWTITTGGQVAVNGVADGSTSSVIELAYVNHAVWYETSGGLWRYKTQASDIWQPAGGTTTSPVTINESPNNTTVTTVGPVITDSHGNTFAINSGAQIVINGTIDTTTANVTELAYVNHVLWQLNTAGNWYNYLGSPGSWGGPTTTSPLPVEFITIGTINTQIANASFTVSGSVSGVSVAPTLQYQDNTGAWTALPAGAIVTLGSGNTATFSFTHLGMAVNPTNTVSVRDANNVSVSASSNGFAVTSATETLALNAIGTQTTNVSFQVSGTIANTTSVPTLQYQNNGGAWTSLPAGATVTLTSFSFTNPGLAVNPAATVSVRDANNNTITATATFAVNAVTGGSTTWNPADTSTSIALSGNNLTALSNSAVRGGTRSVSSQSTGKYCFDITAGTVTANMAVGISNTSYALSGTLALGADANSVGFYPALTGSLQSSLYNGTQILHPVLSSVTPTSGGTLYDASGNAWTMHTDAQVYENGNLIPDSQGTAQLAIINNVIYGQDASTLNWFTFSTTTQTWTPASAPTLPTASVADVSGDVITTCVDLTAQKEWVSTPAMRSVSGVTWNSDVLANQNPATGTGGASFSGLNCPCFITSTTTNAGTSTTLNTTGPLVLTLPSGFQVWQPVPVIQHHPFIFNFGQAAPANDNAQYVPVRFERAAQ